MVFSYTAIAQYTVVTLEVTTAEFVATADERESWNFTENWWLVNSQCVESVNWRSRLWLCRWRTSLACLTKRPYPSSSFALPLDDWWRGVTALLRLWLTSRASTRSPGNAWRPCTGTTEGDPLCSFLTGKLSCYFVICWSFSRRLPGVKWLPHDTILGSDKSHYHFDSSLRC